MASTSSLSSATGGAPDFGSLPLPTSRPLPPAFIPNFHSHPLPTNRPHHPLAPEDMEVDSGSTGRKRAVGSALASSSLLSSRVSVINLSKFPSQVTKIARAVPYKNDLKDEELSEEEELQSLPDFADFEAMYFSIQTVDKARDRFKACINKDHKRGLPGALGWLKTEERSAMFKGVDLYACLKAKNISDTELQKEVDTRELTFSQERVLKQARDDSKVSFTMFYPGETQFRPLPSTTVAALRNGTDLPFLPAYFNIVSSKSFNRADYDTLKNHYIKKEPRTAEFWWKKCRREDLKSQRARDAVEVERMLAENDSASSSSQTVHAAAVPITESLIQSEMDFLQISQLLTLIEYTIPMDVQERVQIWFGNTVITHVPNSPEPYVIGMHRYSEGQGIPFFKALIDQAREKQMPYLLGWMFYRTSDGLQAVPFDGSALYESFTQQSSHPDFSSGQNWVLQCAREIPTQQAFFAILYPDEQSFRLLPVQTVDALSKGDPNSLVSLCFQAIHSSRDLQQKAWDQLTEIYNEGREDVSRDRSRGEFWWNKGAHPSNSRQQAPAE